MLAALGLALQVSVVATAPETVTVRVPFTVVVTVSAPAAERPQLVPPRVDPFIVRDVSRRVVVDTSSSPVNWRNTEWRFTILPPPTGTYTLPPFEARAGRAIARSLPKRIVVAEARARATDPAIVHRANVDTLQGVGFHALVVPDTVWVGQQATYQVGVFLEDAVRLRLRRNPEFVPPELRAMLAYDLPPVGQAPTVRRVGGKRYEVHVFERALFPLTPGRYEIPPARLVYSLPLSSSFFSREESRTARSEARVIVAREAPSAGRPDDWNGAVGALAVRARVDATSARVGDPMLLTVSVAGRGNVKLLPRPRVTIPWATVVPADERVRVDSAPSVVRGAKEFDYIVTPRAAGAQELPGVRYPVFNPYTERYEILATAPESLAVGDGTLAAAEPSVREEAPMLPLRAALRPGPATPAHDRRWFWLVALAAPLPAALVAFARRPRRVRIVTAPERLRGFARGRGRPAPALLRKTYARAVADRLGLSAALLTERAQLAHAMRRAGVTPETARDAADFLAELNDAAWAGRERAAADAAARALELYARVDAEARVDPSVPLARATPVAGRTVALGLLLGASAAVAGAVDVPYETARALFVRASALYADRRAPEAERLFAAVSARMPESPDAWANLGTAAWAAGDTTVAVVGWQRALRLEPTAFDMRQRIALVGAPTPPLEGLVPPVTSGAAALVALLAWCTAWGVLAVARWRRVHGTRAWSVAALGVASVAALTAVMASEAAHATRLVVLDGGTLRNAPALGAEEVPGDVARGSVARRTRQRGAWLHVELGDGRDGWIADADARSLAR